MDARPGQVDVGIDALGAAEDAPLRVRRRWAVGVARRTACIIHSITHKRAKCVHRRRIRKLMFVLLVLIHKLAAIQDGVRLRWIILVLLQDLTVVPQRRHAVLLSVDHGNLVNGPVSAV